MCHLDTLRSPALTPVLVFLVVFQGILVFLLELKLKPTYTKTEWPPYGKMCVPPFDFLLYLTSSYLAIGKVLLFLDSTLGSENSGSTIGLYSDTPIFD